MRKSTGMICTACLLGLALIAGSTRGNPVNKTTADSEDGGAQRAGNGAILIMNDTSYLEFTDSPFSAIAFDSFYLEDFEDELLDTPGVSALTGGVVYGPSPSTDSVDGDDGNIDGSGLQGHAFWTSYDTAVLTFDFDPEILGSLPTHVGIVWTDVGYATPINSYGNASFEAFDMDGQSLGAIGPVAVGDGSMTGETAEDRFFGAVSCEGISKIEISMDGSVDWSVDHLQYGTIGSAAFTAPGTPYSSFADSPFLGTEPAFFYIENFEDGALNTPGVTALTGGSVFGPASTADSVDGDDGILDGSGQQGHSFWTSYSTTILTFDFDTKVLGALPTHAGIVWTDVGISTPTSNYGNTTFEAFDVDGQSLGVIGPIAVGDGSRSGETAEDRFFGIVHCPGISRVSISMDNSEDWEVDHLQYSKYSIPMTLIFSDGFESGNVSAWSQSNR